MPALIAFFTSLPAIITLLGQFGSLFQKILAAAEQNHLNAWVNDLEKHIDSLSTAENEEEKYSAIKDLLNSIRNLGRH